MARNVRERMVTGALDLLGRKGLQATSFAEVTQATSTPRGSIYHHFPGGKQEMIREALELNAIIFRRAMSDLPHESPAGFVQAAVDWWRAFIETRDFKAGCAVAAVTVAAESEEQLDQTARVFDDFIAVVQEGLATSGATSRDETRAFAVLVISSLEGANILARSARNFVAFDLVMTQLVERAGHLQTA